MSLRCALRLLTVTAAVAAAAAPTPASAHAGATHPGTKERALEALETATLGEAHAKEHAAQRALLRRPAVRRRIARDARRARRAAISAHAAGDPASEGQWAPPIDLPNVAIHAALLPTGKIMFFSKPNENKPVTLYDPATGSLRSITPPMGDAGPANIFCSSQGFLPDGRLVVMGGNLSYPDKSVPNSTYKGLKTVFTFNPFNETWTRQPDMAHGRWYPTQVELADGRIMVMDGYDESGIAGPSNPDIEVFTPSADMNGVGTVKKVATRGGDGQPPRGGTYPHMWLMPDGKTLVAGPQASDSWLINPLGPGDAFSWSDVPDPHEHWYGSGVLLPSDTPGSSSVELFDGSPKDGVDRNEVFDEANPAAGWRLAPSFNTHRSYQNTVITPDGNLVTLGGGLGDDPVTGSKYDFKPDQLKVELRDQATGDWRFGPAQQDARTYHGVAVLLPDGRIWSAGDDGNDYRGGDPQTHDTAEIYSPPYLFKGARPAIAAAPAGFDYGASFSVGYTGSDVAKAVLVAPAAVTHANDMNQRYVPLPIKANAGGTVTLAAPANVNLAPSGWYMLFLVNRAGVPSVAKFVHVGGPVPATGQQPGVPTPQKTTPTTPRKTLVALLRRTKAKRTSVKSLIKRGLRVPVACSRRCIVDGRLTLTRKAARGLGLRRTFVGHGSVQLKSAGRRTLVVRLGHGARKRLAGRRSVTFKLRVSATGVDGKREGFKQTVRVKR